MMRQKESLPQLDRIFDWCRENADKYDLPTDLLGKAIRYALNQESVLRIYCTDGRLPKLAVRVKTKEAFSETTIPVWKFFSNVQGLSFASRAAFRLVFGSQIRQFSSCLIGEKSVLFREPADLRPPLVNLYLR